VCERSGGWTREPRYWMNRSDSFYLGSLETDAVG
jgi:hypothetical protein